MSIIGDKIHRIRDFRGMTQKQLGVAAGFDERSARTVGGNGSEVPGWRDQP